LIHDLPAAGKTASQLQQEIGSRLSAFVSKPVVTVMVKQFNSFKISILGQVRRPDVYRVMQKITVLDAIAMAGGFTEFAKQDRVVVIRNNSTRPQRIIMNLKRYIKEGNGELFYLKPSDVLYVE
jgi:polysaccharide export outer membrane protein